MLRVTYSNRIEELFYQLAEKNCHSDLSPFAERILIAPSPWVKAWLMEHLAQDERIGSTLGFKILSLDEALSYLKKKLSPSFKRIPTLLELMALIEGELNEIDDTEIQVWIGSNQKRKLYIAQELATLFQKYGKISPRCLKGWQKILWDKLFHEESMWTYPYAFYEEKIGAYSKPIEIDLFGITYLSKLELSFLKQLADYFPVDLWLLSPCLHFWSDITSEKEKKWLLKLSPEAYLQNLDQLLSDTNPLLADFGKLGREMTKLLDEEVVEQEANYLISKEAFIKGGYEVDDSFVEMTLEKASLLRFIQTDLLFMRNPFSTAKIEIEKTDRSIEIHSLPSKLREIEWAKELILRLIYENKKDILILAPDIDDYAIYIERVFHDLPYTLSGRKKCDEHPLSLLLDLYLHPSKEWKASLIIKIISSSSFDSEEISLLAEWISEHKIHQVGSRPLFERFMKEKAEITYLELMGKWSKFYHTLKSQIPPLQAPLSFWIEWLEKNPIEISDEFIFDFKVLSKKLSKEISFDLFSEMVKQALQRNNEREKEHNLGQLRFASLAPMRAQPAETIILLGMKEGSFPRRDKQHEWDLTAEFKEKDWAPSKTDFDRSLFLEVILSARDHFFILWSESENPSLAVTELKDYIKEAFKDPSIVYYHPKNCHDRLYFEKDSHLKAYSLDHYHAASVEIKPFKPTLDLSFTDNVDNSTQLISLRDLESLLKDPVKHFLKKAGIKEREEESYDEQETFSLNNLEKWKTKRAYLDKKPLLFQSRGLFESMKRKEEEKEHLEIEEALNHHSLGPITSQAILPTKEFPISGIIPHTVPTGIVSTGKKSAKDLLQALPQLLLSALHNKDQNTIYFLKDKKSYQLKADPKQLLKKILTYAAKSKTSPYPFIPDVLKPLLKKDVEKVQSGLKKYDFSLDAKSIIDQFHEEAKELFEEVLDDL